MTPSTKAGRALLDVVAPLGSTGLSPYWKRMRECILAIEAEARTQVALPDVAELAKALRDTAVGHSSWRCDYPDKGEPPCDFTDEAEAILEALATPPTQALEAPEDEVTT